MPKHYLRSTASELLGTLATAYSKGDFRSDEVSELRADLFRDRDLAQYAILHNNVDMDSNFIGRLLGDRCIEIRETCMVDRPKNFFLDLFRDRNLFYDIQPGQIGSIFRTEDYGNGDVRFIGDKVDDLPTTGIKETTSRIVKNKYFGKSVEYGRLELWEAACSGRDIVADRIRQVEIDTDHFLECLIVAGALPHGFHGFVGHPDIPVLTVPASVSNGPATDWLSKSPEEVLVDFQLMVDTIRAGSNYMISPDTMILSDMRYSHVNTSLLGVNGQTILSRWIDNVSNTPTGGLNNIIPFPPYDTAAIGNLPMATVGIFERQYIEMGYMVPRQLETQTHALKWKIPFVGAASPINIKKKNRFASFDGI